MQNISEMSFGELAVLVERLSCVDDLSRGPAEAVEGVALVVAEVCRRLEAEEERREREAAIRTKHPYATQQQIDQLVEAQRQREQNRAS